MFVLWIVYMYNLIGKVFYFYKHITLCNVLVHVYMVNKLYNTGTVIYYPCRKGNYYYGVSYFVADNVCNVYNVLGKVFSGIHE